MVHRDGRRFSGSGTIVRVGILEEESTMHNQRQRDHHGRRIVAPAQSL
jgi:hypothetical protein